MGLDLLNLFTETEWGEVFTGKWEPWCDYILEKKKN